MREIYAHELLSRMGRPHGDCTPVDWTDFLTYANEKEAELWRIFHHELDLVSPLPPIYTPPLSTCFLMLACSPDGRTGTAAWTPTSCGPRSPKPVCPLPSHPIPKRVLMCAFLFFFLSFFLFLVSSQFNPWLGIELHPSTVIEFIGFLTSSPHSNSVNFPEFRDFLLLMPRKASTSEIYRYYQTRKFLGDDGRGSARVNMEGAFAVSTALRVRDDALDRSSLPAPEICAESD